MSDFSSNLQLPYLMPAQAQKHVTVNEALRRMDVLVQMRVQSRTVTAQPAAPGDGQLWILPAGKTGADWDGFTAGRIAYYRDGSWEEITPRAGWFAFVVDADELDVCTSGGWTSAMDAAGALLESECAAPSALKAIDQGLASADTPQFAGVNIGHAGDTTLTRLGAGRAAVEGAEIALRDDGVWTPTVAFGGASVGVAYHPARYGRYTRIGRLMMIEAYVPLTSKGSSTGAMTIGGLPAAPAASNHLPIPAIMYLPGAAHGGAVTTNPGATSLIVWDGSHSAGWVTATDADADHATYIYLCGVYTV